MAIRKYKTPASTRHAKITGDFSEALVLYWLSKYGFECARVDHTGIDIIARKPHNKGKPLGISVKSRSRLREGSDEESVTIPKDNFKKAKKACKAFRCVPYIAVVVDAKDKKTIFAFMTSMEHLREIFPKRKTGSFWKMGKRNLEGYLQDPEIKSFTFTYETMNWWSKSGQR